MFPFSLTNLVLLCSSFSWEVLDCVPRHQPGTGIHSCSVLKFTLFIIVLVVPTVGPGFVSKLTGTSKIVYSPAHLKTFVFLCVFIILLGGPGFFSTSPARNKSSFSFCPMELTFCSLLSLQVPQLVQGLFLSGQVAVKLLVHLLT